MTQPRYPFPLAVILTLPVAVGGVSPKTAGTDTRASIRPARLRTTAAWGTPASENSWSPTVRAPARGLTRKTKVTAPGSVVKKGIPPRFADVSARPVLAATRVEGDELSRPPGLRSSVAPTVV